MLLRLVLCLATAWVAIACDDGADPDGGDTTIDVLDTADSGDDTPDTAPQPDTTPTDLVDAPDPDTALPDTEPTFGCGFGVCADGELCCQAGDALSCVDGQSDAAHCGACGNACEAGESCVEGVCRCGDAVCTDQQACCTDADGQPACRGVIADTANCGACDNACGIGELCAGGTCACAASDGSLEVCDNAAGKVCCPGRGCMRLGSDPLNCGACGISCGVGELCVDGRCRCGTAAAEQLGPVCATGQACCGEPGVCQDEGLDACRCGGAFCGSGQVCCGGVDDGAGGEVDACILVGSDAEHCGACGVSCGVAQTCSQGQCTCEPTFADCDGDATNGCESQPLYDAQNCGACGNACPAGQLCEQGSCVVTCSAAFTACGLGCYDLQTATVQCGACGNVCPEGTLCNGHGQCDLSCQLGLSRCSEGCFDLVHDWQNCGACGNPCSPGQVCNGAAMCDTSCQAGLTDCGGSCYDLDRYRRHCGACGNVCADGLVCDGTGQCALSCQAGLTDCGGNCVDVDTEFAHCGACGNACQPGDQCVDGTCVRECLDPLLACDGTCVDPRYDPDHCGACDNACSAAFAYCNNGACECPPGMTDCGTVCADLNRDPTHCGTCADACPAGELCFAGGCVDPGACSPPLIECNGACFDIDTNPLHCGACNQPCGAGQLCVGGMCQCTSGLTDCDGDGNCEAYLQSDPAHCGACNIACGDGQVCNAGVCQCDWNRISCDGDATTCEVAPLANTTTCGDCTTSCAVTESCRGGLCVAPDHTRLATGARALKTITSQVATWSSTPVCVIDDVGAVRCAGNNYVYQALGRTTTTDADEQFLPVDGLDGSTVQAVSVTVGRVHGCALLSTGEVRCWGNNERGQGGGGAVSQNNPSPVTVVGIDGVAASAVSVDAGDDHTCALLTTGEVRCWGWGTEGRLGNGATTSNNPTPVTVTGIDGVLASAAKIAMGDRHGCALLTTGEVRCWGYGIEGQLGDGLVATSSTPVTVTGLDGSAAGSIAVDLIAGINSSCALRDDGQVLCWGRNDDSISVNRRYDVFGQGFGDLRVTTPAPVTELPASLEVVSLVGGRAQRCALASDGEWWCWGFTLDCTFEHLGAADRPPFALGLGAIVEVAVADGNLLALRADGTIVARGDNGAGMLGRLPLRAEPDPVAVLETDCPTPLEPTLCPPVTGVADVGIGLHGCLVRTDGTVACWGANRRIGTSDPGSSDSLLGQGRISALDESTHPLDVYGLTNAVQAVVGYDHACVLQSSGGLMCWGDDIYGSVGDGLTDRNGTPVQVLGIDGVTASAVSVDAGKYHTCAALSTGEARCWGYSSQGRLGAGAGLDVRVREPIAVTGIDGTAASATAVATGEDFSCALLDTGEVRCWGVGSSGQLGAGSTVTSSDVPVQVTGLDGVSKSAVAIAAGESHACALLDDDTVECWGSNFSGELGDPAFTDFNSFTPRAVVFPAGTTATPTAVDGGLDTTCALMSDQTVLCWGNTFGDSPALVSGIGSTLAGAVTVDAALQEPTVCVALVDGSAVCLGGNNRGALGNGAVQRACEPIELLP